MAAVFSAHRRAPVLFLGTLFVAAAFVAGLTDGGPSLAESRDSGATVAGPKKAETTGASAAPLSKPTTSKVDTPAFVPPPRTVDDVLAILSSNRSTALSKRQEWEAIAKTKPPQVADDHEMARFYLRRGVILGLLGRVKEELADLNHALELAGGDRIMLADVHQNLSMANVHAGNYRLGLEYRRQGVALLNPATDTGKLLGRYATLAAYEAKFGNFAEAEAALAGSRQMLPATERWTRGREWIPFLSSLLISAESAVLGSQGHYREAEAKVREVIALLESDARTGKESEGDMGWRLSELRQWTLGYSHYFLALDLLRQGRLVEAEIAARRSVEIAAQNFGRLTIITAEVLPILAEVLMEEGRPADAGKIAGETVAIYREMGVASDSLAYALARVALAEALAAQEKWPEVVELYHAIERDMANEREVFDHFIGGSASWAMAEIAAGQDETTIARLKRIYERRRRDLGEKHVVTAETGGLLAAALVARGRAREALPIFDAVFPVIASNSRDSAEDGVTQAARDRRIAFILEANLRALAERGGDDPSTVDKALRVAAEAQGRSVQRAVLEAAARAAVSDPQLADLVRREQDARKQIGALNGILANMMSAPPGARDTSAETQVRAQVDQLRTARAAMAENIESRFPDYAALTNPKPVGVAGIQGFLRPGEALLATYVGETQSFVWAVPDRGKALFRAVPKDARQVAGDVDRLRRALDPDAATLGDIPDFDLALAHAVYRNFLEPVKPAWDRADSLLVVADGPLGQIPMDVLVTEKVGPASDDRLLFDRYRDVPWLARDHAVTVLPSVTALAALRGLPSAPATRQPFVGFGDPVFRPGAPAPAAAPAPAPAETLVASRGLPVTLRSAPKLRGVRSADLALLPPLPETADELTAIASALGADPGATVFIGSAAAEDRVKSMPLDGYRIVAFATHGLVPGDLDGLTQPALALSAPAAVGGGGDGLLTMEEILALRLDADWVVLSACNTGAAEGRGAEAVSGLGRAFFYAGTRSVLVSYWPVESSSAKALTTGTFRIQAEQPALDRAAALQRAMLELIDGPGFVDPASGKAVFSYAHPIFWAPFSVIGDGGGGGSGT